MIPSLWQDRHREFLEHDDAFPAVASFTTMVTEPDVVSTWREFEQWHEGYAKSGYFRGHADSSWSLTPTLYRAAWKHFEIDEFSRQFGPITPRHNERTLLSKFQQAAHLYHPHVPAHDELIDWLALMQHYGAPTRLLDWTLSPYVALYFAMASQARESNEVGALWSIDGMWLRECSEQRLQKYPNYATEEEGADNRYHFLNTILRTSPLETNFPPTVIVANPRRTNERMIVQQGVLLYDANGEVFAPALIGMVRQADVSKQVVSKLNVNRKNRIEFLERLRKMNIHAASLFPGIDGLARSLAAELESEVEDQVEILRQEMLARKKETMRACCEELDKDNRSLAKQNAPSPPDSKQQS